MCARAIKQECVRDDQFRNTHPVRIVVTFSRGSCSGPLSLRQVTFLYLSTNQKRIKKTSKTIRIKRKICSSLHSGSHATPTPPKLLRQNPKSCLGKNPAVASSSSLMCIQIHNQRRRRVSSLCVCVCLCPAWRPEHV